MVLTYARLEEIERLCREETNGGPWVDQLTKILTEEENAEILKYWKTLSGNSCFVSAMYGLKIKLQGSQTY